MDLKHNPFGLAPMAGFTDHAMRTLCRSYGCGLLVTEMVSAKALTFGNPKSFMLLDTKNEAQPVAVQLFGSEPAVMAEGARIAVAHGAQMIDVNMGCPVPKVAGHGEGSGLLRTPKKAAALVVAMTTAVDVPVSVKMRIGWDVKDPAIVDFAKRMEASGAAMLCVHGRTRSQYYEGKADWPAIAEIVAGVSIPVLANGDIWSVADARRCQEITGAAGFMIGRGALGRPWFFAELLADWQGRPLPPAPNAAQRCQLIRAHAELAVADKGEFIALRELRKVIGHYVKGLPGAVDMRRACSHLERLEDLDMLLAQWQGALLRHERWE